MESPFSPSATGTDRPHRILLLFLDGVGIGPSDPTINPFLHARIPNLRTLLGGEPPTLSMLEMENPGPAQLIPLDACMGVAGLPQSGTGQVSLLTGTNAPRDLGRHFGPWPPVHLRPTLERDNLLVRAARSGGSVIFANAYPENYPEGRNRRLVAAPPLAARAAGHLTRHHHHLREGQAVASEIVNDGWRVHLGHDDIPQITPEEAGENLARIAGDARLTLFAHYLTDLAGHRGGMVGGIDALERVDRFLGGLLTRLGSDTLLLLVSDHGNLEDIRGGHTRNPALGLAVGPGSHQLPPAPGLHQLAPAILGLLGVPDAHVPAR